MTGSPISPSSESSFILTPVAVSQPQTPLASTSQAFNLFPLFTNPKPSSPPVKPTANMRPLTPIVLSRSQSNTSIPSKTTKTSKTKPSGIYLLPVPGTRNAPKKFKGKFSRIKLFIKHYEKLCVQKEVKDDEEKIQNITQYCSRSVREFMEGLTSYTGKNWDIFVQDLMEFYDAERDTKRYKRGDLEAYCRRKGHKKSTMRLPRWKQYNREFIRIAGWLVSHKKLSLTDQSLYFWKGIPQDFRDKLEARLLAINPDHDLEIPFDMEQVSKVAKSFLQRNRFDHDRVQSDDDITDLSSSDSEYDSSDSEFSSDSDSDTDKEDRRKSKKSKRHKSSRSSSKASSKEKKKVHFKSSLKESSRSEPKSPVKTKAEPGPDKSQEVEELINKMNRLSIHDPTYSVLYYRACHLDPIVSHIMVNPQERQEIAKRMLQKQSAESRGTYSNTNSTPVFERATPPHMRPGSNAYQQSPLPGDRKCFGCGGTGHTMFYCSKIDDLVSKGVLSKDNSGKLVMADGSFIRRMMNESFVEAAERLRPVQSNYISVVEPKVDGYDSDSMDSDTDSDSDSDRQVFIATRSQARTTRSKKLGSDDMYPSARLRHESKHPRFSDRSRTKKIVPSDDEEILTVPKVPKPVNVEETIFNPDNEDAFMEDTTPAGLINRKRSELQVTPKRLPRQTDLQSQVNRGKILDEILEQPMTMPLKYYLGTSKELSEDLRERLKPKAPATPPGISNDKPTVTEKAKADFINTNNPMVAAATIYKAKETLIRLRMECDGMPITAIIDTGSQLNIAHQDVWKHIIARPIDKQNRVSMNDANGGESKLKGLVANVPLNCGSVRTYASIHVGDKVPFDLLLGRPWQRGNFVSIDEREDGTYLLFKDQNMDVRHEILVTPDEQWVEDPEVTDYIHRARRAKFQVNMITIQEDIEESGTDADDEHSSDSSTGIDIEGTETYDETTSMRTMSLIPRKRKILPPMNERPSNRPRRTPVIDVQSKYEIMGPIASTSRIELDEGAPGLSWPITDREVQSFASLWEQTCKEDPEETRKEDEEDEDIPDYETTETSLEVIGEDTKKWELRQILTKTSTREWRANKDIPSRPSAITKAVSRARRRRRSRVNLVKEALENHRESRVRSTMDKFYQLTHTLTAKYTQNPVLTDAKAVPAATRHDKGKRKALPDLPTMESHSNRSDRNTTQRVINDRNAIEAGSISSISNSLISNPDPSSPVISPQKRRDLSRLVVGQQMASGSRHTLTGDIPPESRNTNASEMKQTVSNEDTSLMIQLLGRLRQISLRDVQEPKT
ncbi:hypothetical protein QCA50_010251 [Cerrena zonata]|uniref:CCHC-type domain-containing protein n=1 Tax=Cerrena zonata TaxID=2478898 RepID=A0AAW0G0U7_9APHY